MNANLPASSCKEWLAHASEQLTKAGIITARLDALVLLSDQIGKDKSWLFAHPEAVLKPTHLALLEQKLNQRSQRTPLAYIRGHQEFYGRDFIVTQDTLIPRPESEALIEELKKLSPKKDQVLVDVGTGSGNLAITATLEWPALEVHGLDVSPAALEVAVQNAAVLGAKVAFDQSDLLTKWQEPVDFIVANLPYVDEIWIRSPETKYEPSIALFAPEGGLALIFRLIAQAGEFLKPSGTLLLEADPRQHHLITTFARTHNFFVSTRHDFVVTLQK